MNLFNDPKRAEKVWRRILHKAMLWEKFPEIIKGEPTELYREFGIKVIEDDLVIKMFFSFDDFYYNADTNNYTGVIQPIMEIGTNSFVQVIKMNISSITIEASKGNTWIEIINFIRQTLYLSVWEDCHLEIIDETVADEELIKLVLINT